MNIPANAPHSFRNISGSTVRMLCLCTPAGQEEDCLAVGDLLEARTALPAQSRPRSDRRPARQGGRPRGPLPDRVRGVAASLLISPRD
nr:hypothetical protein [uncultured Lichenicoccus sp.]